jgi:hypothetical protein
LQGEGGSHFLDLYHKLPFIWISFLQKNFGLTHFFLEAGHSSAVLLNQFLKTGDTSFIFVKEKKFWKRVYEYNSSLSADQQLHYFGIDFERASSFVKALQFILPASEPSPEIAPAIGSIRSASGSINDCNYVIGLNKPLKRSLKGGQQEYEKYFGDRFDDFKRIVSNNGDCNDRFKNRNKNMADNFLSFDALFGRPVYFGELGEAHTVLTNKNTAILINSSDKFRNKVCVINLYCYNCTTEVETVSNWPLKAIEKDIIEELLPYCYSPFTLFDFSEQNELTKKFRSFGQFLIVATDQH